MDDLESAARGANLAPPRPARATPRAAVDPLPLERLWRATDPWTSLAAAQRAAKASRPAIAAVARLMLDGRGRIDEEVWLDLRPTFPRSLATIQHARLALSEAGLVRATGATRPTSDTGPSREWIAAPGADLAAAAAWAGDDDG